MKKGLWGFMTMGFMLAAWLLAAVPAGAQSVDDKIQALEQELGRLKAEQEQTKSEQMELRREATAAAAALPSFTYRTGFLGITAADKSWQFSTSFEFHVHMYNHIGGKTFAGSDTNQNFTTGDLFLRRNRPFFYYCWDDCLYEIGFGIDQDDGDITGSQHARFLFHLENIHPFYPTIEISGRGNEQLSYVQRSSSSSARLELTRDLLDNGFIDTLSHTAIGIGWLDTPVWTGDFTLWTEYRVGPFSQNENSDTDRKQFFTKVGARPFSQIKNKWIQRFKIGTGFGVASVPNNAQSDWGKRLALRTDDRIGRIRTMDANNIGGGRTWGIWPGVEWGVGPYLFRNEIAYGFYKNDKDPAQPFNGNEVKGLAWSLQNELFLWSPKGFLTGSSRTPGSVLMGFSFARSRMDCGSGADCTPGASTSSKGHLIKREVDLWYFIRPGLNIGTWLSWWSTPNMPTTLQERVGCTSNPSVGRDCSWYSVNLGLRANF